jgi:hypothetical protein
MDFIGARRFDVFTQITIKMESFNQLKELVQKNPEVLKYLQQPDPRKEPKKPKIIPGQTIELPESDAPIPISMAQAKQLLKKPRKPRNLSEESKAKMLANLQKGREALKLKKDHMIQQAKKTIVEQTKPPAAKFIVKQPAAKPKKTKAVVVEDVLTDDESLEVQLERNEALLRKVQQMQKQSYNERVPPPPALKRQKRFSLFY